jgi:hypothetical protein
MHLGVLVNEWKCVATGSWLGENAALVHSGGWLGRA